MRWVWLQLSLRRQCWLLEVTTCLRMSKQGRHWPLAYPAPVGFAGLLCPPLCLTRIWLSSLPFHLASASTRKTTTCSRTDLLSVNPYQSHLSCVVPHSITTKSRGLERAQSFCHEAQCKPELICTLWWEQMEWADRWNGGTIGTGEKGGHLFLFHLVSATTSLAVTHLRSVLSKKINLWNL